MKLNQKNKAGFLLTIFFMLALAASAQKTFKYEAALNKVDSSGFYRINFKPEFVAKSNPGLTDVRLMDANGKLVSYISAADGPRTDVQKFQAFKQIHAKALNDTGTTFIVEADNRKIISSLYARVKNTEVERFVSLSGSDDLKNWYAIKENIPLKGDFLNEDGTYMQLLAFPAVSYHYFKLLVNDRRKTPIRFLQVGNYISLPIKDTYLPVPHEPIMRKDSSGVTYITIRLSGLYQVNLLKFTISSPKYYKRIVRIYEFNNNVRQLADTGEISSNSMDHVSLNVKRNKIELQIINGDSPPLNITDIATLQEKLSIISYLEKGKPYKLLTGNAKAIAPEYDLKFFLDSIHGYLPEISHGQVIKNSNSETPAQKEPKHNYNIFIWMAIIIALLLLSMLSWKMISEINMRKDN